MIRNYLPNFIERACGENWGLSIINDDSCWIEYQSRMIDLYDNTQRQGLGAVVNGASYKVMAKVQMDNKRVLEVGAGDIRHMSYWSGRPAECVLADVSSSMMNKAEKGLKENTAPYQPILLNRSKRLRLKDYSIDVLVSLRLWFKKNTNVDPEKIICWELPNFSDKVIELLDNNFDRSKVKLWPESVPLIDLNLIIQFVYHKGS